MDDGQLPPDRGLPDGVEAEPARLLGFVREQHRARMVADAHLYAAAAAWADQHSSETITAADWVPGGDTARPVAGLHVEAWQAGRVADATMVLDPAAAAWVDDAQVASCVAKVGDTQLGRLIGEAIARFDPVQAEQERTAQDQVATWCGTDTRVTLTPVIDTTDCIAVDAYEVPDRLREQVLARDPTCVFRWCTRPARTAECDHVIAYADRGPTRSCNLAPGADPTTASTPTPAGPTTSSTPGTYLWTTPHGHRLRRDPTGTTPLDPRCGCHHQGLNSSPPDP